MKVVATSDLHGSLPEIPECDLLVVAGDVCPDYIKNRKTGDMGGTRLTKGEGQQANWLRNWFKPWLEDAPAKAIVGIAGNHDFVFEMGHMVRQIELPWVYLQDSMAEVLGVRVYGLPWVPNLPFWAFYADDRRLEMSYKAVQPCDLLVSHGPPLGYGDVAPSKYGSSEGEHVGAAPAIAAIERAKPSHYICGHIHEGYGAYVHKGVGILNAAHNTGSYSPINEPLVFDI